jgi:hypothetical protein
VQTGLHLELAFVLPTGVFGEQRSLYQLVQLIQVDLSQDGADDPALRGPAQREASIPVLDLSGREQAVQQPVEAVIVDFLAED